MQIYIQKLIKNINTKIRKLIKSIFFIQVGLALETIILFSRYYLFQSVKLYHNFVFKKHFERRKGKIFKFHFTLTLK